MNYFLKLFLVLGLTAILFTSCDDDEATMSNIVELATADSDLSTLAEALTQADLIQTLEGEGPFTVFAPTNAAFDQLLIDLGVSALSDIDNTTLTNVLLYHVLSGKTNSTDLSTSYIKTLSPGPVSGTNVDAFVQTGTEVTINSSSRVTAADIEASNGVIHKIDKVLLPANVVTLAASNADFGSLVAALTRDDNTTDFVGVLSGAGPFTVFAPTNLAFQALLDSSTDWNTLNDIPQATLDLVLKYHVASGANVLSSDLTDGQSVSTLSGTDFTIDLDNGPQILTNSGQKVDITSTDVQGVNGIIHVLNAVLLP